MTSCPPQSGSLYISTGRGGGNSQGLVGSLNHLAGVAIADCLRGQVMTVFILPYFRKKKLLLNIKDLHKTKQLLLSQKTPSFYTVLNRIANISLAAAKLRFSKLLPQLALTDQP